MKSPLSSCTCTPSFRHMAPVNVETTIRTRLCTTTRLMTTAASLSRTATIPGTRAHRSMRTPECHLPEAGTDGWTVTQACRLSWQKSSSKKRTACTLPSARIRTHPHTHSLRRRTHKNLNQRLTVTTIISRALAGTETTSNLLYTPSHTLVSLT